MQYATRTPGMIELVFTVVNKEDKIIVLKEKNY